MLNISGMATEFGLASICSLCFLFSIAAAGLSVGVALYIVASWRKNKQMWTHIFLIHVEASFGKHYENKVDTEINSFGHIRLFKIFSSRS